MALETSQDRRAPVLRKKSRRSQLRKAISRGAQYCLLRVAVAFLSRLPLSWGRALAWLAGTCAFCLARRERRIAIFNLGQAFGEERSPREIRRMARNVFRHTATMFIEWLILRRWSTEKLERAFPNVKATILSMVDDMDATGRGVSGICAHCGNWEVLSMLVGRYAPGRMYSIARRPKFSRIADLLHRLRCSEGANVVYTDESPRKLIRILRQGHMLGFLPDQDIRTNTGVFVEFFGRPTYTVTFPISLARRMNSSVMVGILLRVGRGFEYHRSEFFEVPRTDDKERDILEATQEWTGRVEEVIRKDPEQWLWLYNRWRTTPEKPRVHRAGGASP